MAKHYKVNQMLLDGYSKEEIAASIAEEQKINLDKIYQDGYTIDDLLNTVGENYNPNILVDRDNLKSKATKELETLKSELKKGQTRFFQAPIKAISGELNFNPDIARTSLENITKIYDETKQKNIDLGELTPTLEAVKNLYPIYQKADSQWTTDTPRIKKIEQIFEEANNRKVNYDFKQRIKEIDNYLFNINNSIKEYQKQINKIKSLGADRINKGKMNDGTKISEYLNILNSDLNELIVEKNKQSLSKTELETVKDKSTTELQSYLEKNKKLDELGRINIIEKFKNSEFSDLIPYNPKYIGEAIEIFTAANRYNKNDLNVYKKLAE